MTMFDDLYGVKCKAYLEFLDKIRTQTTVNVEDLLNERYDFKKRAEFSEARVIALQERVKATEEAMRVSIAEIVRAKSGGRE